MNRILLPECRDINTANVPWGPMCFLPQEDISFQRLTTLSTEASFSLFKLTEKGTKMLQLQIHALAPVKVILQYIYVMVTKKCI